MERPPAVPARRRWLAGALGTVPLVFALLLIAAASYLARPPAAPSPVRVAGISVERAATLDAAPDAATSSAAESAAAVAAVSDADLRLLLLARLDVDWSRLPGWRLRVEQPRDGFRGATRPDEKMILIYRTEGSSFDDYVHVAAHELGHAVDVTLLDDRDRARWLVARGLAHDGSSEVDWWVASGADDFASGAGDWAESFAWYLAPGGSFASRLGPPPDAGQMGLVAELSGVPVAGSAGSG